jgi:hypothetical protein
METVQHLIGGLLRRDIGDLHQDPQPAHSLSGGRELVCVGHGPDSCFGRHCGWG